jgi:hypothetical protein
VISGWHQARIAGDLCGTGKPLDLGEHRYHGQGNNSPHARNGLQALEIGGKGLLLFGQVLLHGLHFRLGLLP